MNFNYLSAAKPNGYWGSIVVVSVTTGQLAHLSSLHTTGIQLIWV